MNLRSPPAPASPPSVTGKYLTFHLATEVYGVAILAVREIVGMQPITAVPQTPSFVKGVIHLRGKVIPVIDLRAKFGLAEAAYTEQSCIIVLHVAGTLVGAIVDRMQEVRDISADQTEPPPPLACSSATEYLLSMAKLDGAVVILLDASKLISREEVGAIATALPPHRPQGATC